MTARSLFVALLLIAAAPPVALADDVPRCEEIRPGIVRCSETRIVGRPGPSGFYVLGRSAIENPPTPLRPPDVAAAIGRSARSRPL